MQTVAAILPVRDVGAALAHYRKLGFTTRRYDKAAPDQPPLYGFLRRDTIHLHLALSPELDPHRNTSAVYLYVDDPDALFREWSAAGPEGCLEGPEDREWGMREMTYVDPDGNLLRIGRYLQGTGRGSHEEPAPSSGVTS
jgi:catechol 2,3-dioxygenase-like lactoylglutathione lyase family enzyme